MAWNKASSTGWGMDTGARLYEGADLGKLKICVKPMARQA
jgi:hypothetical protein